MRSVLSGLAGLKRRFFFGLLQVRTATASISWGDYSSLAKLITGSTPGFRDPTRLTCWTRGFLYAHLAMVLGTLSNRAIRAVLGPVQLPELGGVVWFPLWMVVLFGMMLLVPAWTLLANYNARETGASTMKFTPEWAAGWYFMPPGLFWKPYQAMQEIWKASVQPREWRSQHGSPLVGWWWGMWLVSSWGGVLASGVAALTLEAGDVEVAERAIGLVRGLARVASTVCVLTFIARVHRMQMAHYRESESGCAY